jgi:hypothetical protein
MLLLSVRPSVRPPAGRDAESQLGAAVAADARSLKQLLLRIGCSVASLGKTKELADKGGWTRKNGGVRHVARGGILFWATLCSRCGACGLVNGHVD